MPEQEMYAPLGSLAVPGFDFIWIDPARCGGKPCVRGHRIWVSLILDLVASGETFDDILRSYPDLTIEDIQACIAYGSEMARERFVEIPLEGQDAA